MIALGIAVARAGRGDGLSSLDIMLDLHHLSYCPTQCPQNTQFVL